MITHGIRQIFLSCGLVVCQVLTPLNLDMVSTWWVSFFFHLPYHPAVGNSFTNKMHKMYLTCSGFHSTSKLLPCTVIHCWQHDCHYWYISRSFVPSLNKIVKTATIQLELHLGETHCSAQCIIAIGLLQYCKCLHCLYSIMSLTQILMFANCWSLRYILKMQLNL